MLRILASLAVVGLAFAALGAAVIYLNSRSPELVTATADLAGPMVGELQQEAASGSLGWWLEAILFTALAAAAWLVWALNTHPRTPRDEGRLLGGWLALMLAGLIGAFALGYGVGLNPMIAARWRLGLGVGLLVASPLAFFLATAFGVKNALVPSVPFAHLVRR